MNKIKFWNKKKLRQLQRFRFVFFLQCLVLIPINSVIFTYIQINSNLSNLYKVLGSEFSESKSFNSARNRYYMIFSFFKKSVQSVIIFWQVVWKGRWPGKFLQSIDPFPRHLFCPTFQDQSFRSILLFSFNHRYDGVTRWFHRC